MATLLLNGQERRHRANGEGSIYRGASDNRWVGSAYVYAATGQRKRRPVYGASFDEVRQKLDKLKGNSANGVLVPDRSTNLRDYLEYWLREIAAHRRFHPVYVLAATLGLRRGELLGLRWSDIDFAKNPLQVAQTVQRVSGHLIIDETKTDASDAVVPLPKITRVVLIEHREHQAGRAARVRLYDLRHTVVSLLLELGTPPHVAQATPGTPA